MLWKDTVRLATLTERRSSSKMMAQLVHSGRGGHVCLSFALDVFTSLGNPRLKKVTISMRAVQEDALPSGELKVVEYSL